MRIPLPPAVKTRLKNLYWQAKDVLRRPPESYKHKKLLRIFELCRLYNLIPDTPGDIVECGVGTGSSLLTLAALAKEEGRGRTVWGFDSFEGFPEPAPEDASERGVRKGEWGFATLSRMQSRIDEAKAERVKLVKGFFETTTPHFKQPIALLHIDADLYESYKTVLANLFDNVVPGGVVAFDEYGSKKWPGATKAVDEFLTGKKYELKKIYGKYYLVK